jgi:hypothetical protein
MRRPRFQFSLLGLLTAMAVFGVVLACIVKFGLSLPMVTILWSLLFVTLVVMPVLAFVGKPERRAFHAGGAWFGWMYVLIYMFGFVIHSPMSFTSTSPIRFPQMSIERGMFVVYKWVVPPGSRMFSTNDPESEYDDLALQYDSRIWNPPVAAPLPVAGGLGGFAPPPFPAGAGGGLGGGFLGTAPMVTTPPAPLRPYRYVPWEIFRDVAHALLASLWAISGGVLALLLARRNARRKSENATPTRG